MSDLKQIQSALHRLFHEEANRIVFWNDPDREFEDSIESLSLDEVTTVLLHQAGALDTKIRIDRRETESKFLLYSPTEEPEYENDWLLDIRLFSRSFRADRASILLQELGLANLHLRTHLAERRKFFDSKDRLASTVIISWLLPTMASSSRNQPQSKRTKARSTTNLTMRSLPKNVI